MNDNDLNVSVKNIKKKNVKYKSTLSKMAPYLFLMPWLIGVITLQLGPIIFSFITSFTQYNLGNNMSFIGMDNYIQAATDPLVIQSLINTVKYVFITVPMKLVFALFIAYILNSKIKGIGAYRTVYYLPSIIGGSVGVAILWKALFLNSGMINLMLAKIGITGPSWLGDPNYSLFTVSLLAVWQFGSSMVIFLAGLKQIPSELYEAAQVDGASKVKCFFNVTIPLLTPIIFFNLIMQIIGAFQTFSGPFVIYGGQYGPLNSVLLIVMYIYNQAFQVFDMGYASAISWILLAIIGTFTFILFKSEDKWVFYN
ncbi:MAG: carbohydrate ABC transporter permease [Clostridium sp.]|uniref:carbohydrate ABC transporter permease n=1 Tax=Clostridium sp. TaxID=1506 RepID=UPI003D6D2CDB